MMRIGMPLLCSFAWIAVGVAQTASPTIKSPVAVDRVLPSGDVFAVSSDKKVYQLHDDGTLLQPINTFSIPAYRSPSDLTTAIVNGEQVMIVSGLSQGAGFIDIYDVRGKQTGTWRSTHVLSGVDYSPGNDMIYAASSDSNEIYQVRAGASDDRVAFLSEISGARHLGPVLFDGRRNRLIVGEIDEGQIYALDLKTHRSHLIAHGLGSPQALMLSADANHLYVADSSRRAIYTVDLINENSTPTLFSKATQFREPVGLVPLGSGRIGVADDRADKIFIITSQGSLQNP